MIKYMLNSLKRDLSTNPKITVGLLCLAGVGLIVAVIIIASSLYVPEPPDPATASLDEIQQYLKSDYFLELPAKQRREYTTTLAKRFDSMSAGDREKLNSFFKELTKNNRDVADTVKVGIFSEKLKMFDAPTEKQRQQKVRTAMTIMEAAKGRDNIRQEYQRALGNTPEQQQKRMQDTLKAVSKARANTTPAERRRLMKTFRTISAEARQRYGN